MSDQFEKRLAMLFERQERLLARRNEVDPDWTNGWFERFKYPILTGAHAPVYWRYDLDPKTNPLLLERIGMNAAFNAGAMEFEGKIVLMVRAEGCDRKSFFAVAESATGIDGFRFWDYPVEMPQTADPDINVYDMRLTRHADGWIYGLFCSERKDPAAPVGDTSSAVAQCGIARTHDLKTWERLDDLKSGSPQQRNVVLHPEFIGGKYAFYTRPMDEFISTGGGGGIGWALADNMEHAVAGPETIVDAKEYHTIKEVKNGQGPAPIKTAEGWIHIAHGVRNTAAGLRYVLYAFMTDPAQPWKVTHAPGGYFLAPEGEERIGDVSNVAFCCGLVTRPSGEVLIYYATADTRMHVARTSVERLLDYVKNTPADPLRSDLCVKQRSEMIRRNLEIMKQRGMIK
jgi:4-O-beta-D-mannosyl-D-glucose phosphorylase